MSQKVFVYDPTAADKMSSVRGIGRYLQILKENFPDWTYINNETMKQLNNDSIFINPFFNFLQPPVRSNNDWTLHRRIAHKQIAVIHDLIPLKYPSHFPSGIKGSIYILLNKFALKNYDLIITDSEASKRDIVDILKIKSEKIRVIYPCLPKVFSMEYKVSSIKNTDSKYKILNTKYCLYVGDATWNKNLVNLAKAIKIANVNCVFVGKVFQNNDSGVANAPQNDVILASERSERVQNLNHPWQSELKEFLKLTKGDKRFVFTGFTSDDDLIKLYKQSSFNILPSRDEGFGFSYIESSQFGCPSLLSDIPVLREISDGKALFFNPNNPQEIANKINEINSDKILRDKIGTDAKKRAEFFTPEKFKKELLSVIPA